MPVHPYTRLFILPSAPTVDEDTSEGYEVGDVVFSGGAIYDCTDPTEGAAVWVERNAGLTTEQIQDIVGDMVTGGTELGIVVGYDDTAGKLVFNAQDAGDDRYIQTTGWQEREEEWTRVNNHQFTITGFGDLSAVYHPQRKVRYKDAAGGGVFEYGRISSSSHDSGTGTTTVNLYSNATYQMSAGDVTDTWVSIVDSPDGWPTTVAEINGFVTNSNSHDHSGGDGAQIAHSALSGAGVLSHAALDSHDHDSVGVQVPYVDGVSGRPATNYQTEDIFRVNSSGASAFSGTINGAPSGASVVYNAGFSGNENALVPASTSQLAKLRLYNTTRGNSALISNCNTGTNTITLTANAPANWANGDTITIASQTVSGGSGNWVDLEITSGLTGKTLIVPNVQFTDTGTVTANTLARFHPTETFGTSKIFAVPAPISTFPSVATPWVKVTSNVFTVSWIPSGAATGTLTIRSMGVFE